MKYGLMNKKTGKVVKTWFSMREFWIEYPNDLPKEVKKQFKIIARFWPNVSHPYTIILIWQTTTPQR